MRLTLVALSLLGFVSCSFQHRTIEEELADDRPALAAHYAQSALRAQEEGDYQEAAELYRKAIELVPYDPDLHNNLGTCFYYLGRIDSAIAEFKEAVRLLPSYSTGYVNLGNAYRLQKRYDLAIAALREALRLEPTDARAHTALGLTYDEMGKLDLARKEYETAVRLAPSDVVARFNLGSAYLRQGYLNPAIENLRYVTAEEIGNAQAHYLLALALLAKCDPDGALQELQALQEHPSMRKDALNLMGLAKYAQREFEEARELFASAVEMAPNVAEFRYNLASTLLKLGRPEEARYELRQALELRPQWVRALMKLGETFEKDGDYEVAERYYRQALNQDSTHAVLWHCYGRVLVDRGKIDSGYVALRRALDLWERGRRYQYLPSEHVSVVDDWRFCRPEEVQRREQAEMYVYLGKAYAAKGDQKGMDRAFRRALSTSPAYPEAYETLAEIHALLGRDSEAWRERALSCWARGVRALRRDSLATAATWLRRCLKLLPGLADGYIDLGRVLFLRGEIDSAHTLLRQGVSIDDRKARGYVYLGDYYASVGQLDLAIGAYLKAISLDGPQTAAFRGLSEVYLRLGSDREARRMQAQVRFLEGRELLRRGQPDRALDELLQCIELNPKHFGALLVTGQILYRRSQLEEAVRYFSRAVQIDSTHAEARCWLGTALLEQGQVQRAVRHLEGAVRLDPSLSKAYYQLARAYLEAGQPDRAEEFLRHAHELGFPVPTEFLDRLRSAKQRR